MNEQSEILAFIDESGDPDFNENASKNFIIVAILIDNSYKEQLEIKLEELKSHYKFSELKSFKIKSKKRYDICSKLICNGIMIISINVNKSKLKGNWFKFRDTFYKYIMMKLNYEIYRLSGNAEIKIHNFGSREFQNSLQLYLLKNLQYSFFTPSISIGTTDEFPLIQLADLFSGTIKKILTKELNNHEYNFIELLNNSWRVRFNIPENGTYIEPDFLSDNSGVFKFCLDDTKRYLEIDGKSDSPKTIVLEYLYNTAIQDPPRFVYTYEILAWLKTCGYEYTTEKFRGEIVASLRKDGVIIVSSHEGYKIPTTIDDLIKYIEFSANMALPILKQIKKTREFFAMRSEYTKINNVLSEELKTLLEFINTNS